ncbi:MAG: nucleotidyltransferase, partial [Clostridia bacterium]|nr:nucleotidyltransferase [Clostridia bacterium]
FGGLKQAEPITNDGKCLLDFSVYDAVRAGFNKVVFIIRKDIEQDFKQLVGNRIASKVNVEYVMQDTSALPQGRTKPFGTAHAILCCKDVVKEPFAVINADDYYGCNAFDKIYKHLTTATNGNYAMVAYKLGNTTSNNGAVTRGVCQIENGKLVKIVETHGITSNCISDVTGERFTKDTAVSMNLWGFTCDIFPFLESKYAEFLQTADLSKDEFLIPTAVFDAVESGVATVTAYTNSDKWYGMTYRNDLDVVRKAIGRYVLQGFYKGI